ncbi:LOW QUALITY PROTEIN: hypothetical protein ACHAXH_002433 [Discostella pseudostelligera]
MVPPGHPGAKQLLLQIDTRCYHSDLRGQIDKFNFEHCQRNKLNGKGLDSYQNERSSRCHSTNAQSTSSDHG